MESKEIVTLRDIEDYIKSVYKHGIHFTAKDIEHFSTEEYDERVLDALEMLFVDGRYSMTTEFFIERWDIPEFEEAMNDIRLISQLAPALRTKLKFLRDVLEVGRPLFHRQAPDFTQPPFRFANGDFSVKNRELMTFISTSTRLHLAAVTALAMKARISDEWRSTNGMVVNELGFPAMELDRCNKDTPAEDIKKRIEDMVDLFYDIDNHLELGKRMGLTPRAQYIYDIIDTFICNRYFYYQVDAAKEFDQWLTDNWTGWKEAEEDIKKQQETVAGAFRSILDKNGIADAVESTHFLYLFYDLLGYSDIPESYDCEDDAFDLSDDDIDF